MGQTIIIKSLNIAPDALIKSARDRYKIKLDREQLTYLSDMLFKCLELAEHSEGNELDMLVIEEFRRELEGKFYNVEHKASMKLKPSQAHVLFFWLNETEFPNATYHHLACGIVDQLYRQII